MSLSHDLFQLAGRLARFERRRPKQATLLRATSTAYYAIFHLLTTGSTQILAPNVTRPSSVRMQRWFDHREMKRVCGMFSTSKPPESVSKILQAAPSYELQTLARNFVRLQEARHQADYDLGSTWTRATTLDFVQVTQNAFDAWDQIRRSHEANVFALALLSVKLFEKER